MDIIVSDERDKVEEKSHVKQALNMNDYSDWLINSIPTNQTSLDSTKSVSSDCTCDDGQETERDTTNKKPNYKKFPAVLLPYLIRVSEQIRRMFKQYNITAYYDHIMSVIGKTKG